MHGARPLRSTRRLQNLTGVLPAWWKIENKKAEAGPTLVHIYDEIGMYGVSAVDFLSQLRSISGDIEMHINSPGGDVFDGIAIYNQLKQAQRRGNVHIVVDGVAASAASFIAQAASPGHLEMAPHSTMMIHDGFAMGIGNAADMLELAAQLDRASDNIASIYATRTGKPAEYWRNLMKKETWLSDSETVAVGLADRIQGSGDGGAADWDLSIYGRWRNSGSDDVPIGDGWVMGKDGTPRFDPDGDGDDDATPEGDTDNDYFDENGEQIQEIPPCPKPGVANSARPPVVPAAKPEVGKRRKKTRNANVDNTAWDASKAWHNGATSDDPEAFYRGICAGKRAGDPDTQAGWALPYRYHPGDAPNANGVRAALARMSSTQGLINKDEAQSKLEGLMKKINPDYKPGDMDTGLLSAVLIGALKGDR